MAHSQKYKVQIGNKELALTINGAEIFIDGSKKDIFIDHRAENTYIIVLDGKPSRIFIESVNEHGCLVTLDGIQHHVIVKDERAQLLDRYGVTDSHQSMEKEVRAPMPGLVLDILVTERQEISAGSGLLVLEAMKMENEIRASAAGVISKIHVNPGDAVAKDDLLLELGPPITGV